MIHCFAKPNLILEALSYLGRRTAGNTVPAIFQRLNLRGITEYRGLDGKLAPLQGLMEELDAAIPATEEELRSLFGNLPGFPKNTIGSYSPAFWLFYPLIHLGSPEAIVDHLAQMSIPQLAAQLAGCLDLAEDEGDTLDYALFSARVLAMQIPPESKVGILDLLHDHMSRARRALPYLSAAVTLLADREQVLASFCEEFHRELTDFGMENYISKTSGLNSRSSYCLRPFVLGLDTNLSEFSSQGEAVTVYCGIFRMDLQSLLCRKTTPIEDVYEALRLLADRTRFDILCYLRNRTAYGQELSEHFGLTRNTIHHHMTKLLAAHLVRCTVEGNRVYYTTDRETILALLEEQKSLLV